MISAGRRRVIAVSGGLASSPSFMVSTDPDHPARGLSTTIITQNPIPENQPIFQINTIEPSPTCLEDMAWPPCIPNAHCLLLF